MDAELKKHVLKTGTSTLGIVCKDGIVVAADTKGTYAVGEGVVYVAGSDEEKVLFVEDNIIVTTAGVASDLQKVIKLAKSELKLKELKSKSKPSIKDAANLFATIAYQNIRQFSSIPGITHYLLAGFDREGVYLYDIHPDGYLQKIKDYSATGSGLMHMNPILDSGYDDNLTIEEGVKLARKCIEASSKRDPGSGEGIDIFVVKDNKIDKVVSQKVIPQYIDRKAA